MALTLGHYFHKSMSLSNKYCCDLLWAKQERFVEIPGPFSLGRMISFLAGFIVTKVYCRFPLSMFLQSNMNLVRTIAHNTGLVLTALSILEQVIEKNQS
jgi:hypothetical protein